MIVRRFPSRTMSSGIHAAAGAWLSFSVVLAGVILPGTTNAQAFSADGSPPSWAWQGYVMARPQTAPSATDRDAWFGESGTPLAPMVGAKVYVGDGSGTFTNTYAFSNDKGYYALGFQGQPCYFSAYEYSSIMTAEVFPVVRPKVDGLVMANVYVPVRYSCNGYQSYADLLSSSPSLSNLTSAISILDITSNIARPAPSSTRLDLPVDILYVTGAAHLMSKGYVVPIGLATTYDADGLLTSITRADAENTDVYVFSEATGDYITERNGLRLVANEKASVGLTLPIFGPDYNRYMVWFSGLMSGDWGAQARAAYGELQQMAPTIRPGDRVRVVAINRATGYQGSVVTTLQSLGNAFNSNPTNNGSMFAVVSIDMGYPNIQVTAKRRYMVEAGLTQGTEREYVIGFEGSALRSDSVIELETKWLDHNNRPLPQTLPGYTGRLAKIVEPGKLGPGDSGLVTFPIKPGNERHLILLPGDVTLSKEHFYLHVCGESGFSDQTCQFEQDSDGRPINNVPLLVKEGQGLPRYRPEMQFSTFDFEVEAMKLTDRAGNVTNIVAESLPVISWDQASLDILYALSGPTFEGDPLATLSRYSGDRELAVTLGGQTIAMTLSAAGEATFPDLGFMTNALANTSATELLTLQFVQSSDPDNVLWEYAFAQLAIAVDLNRDGKVDFSDERYADVAGTLPTDKTTPGRPYRFWINNDLDVVSDMGSIRWDKTDCANEDSAPDGGEYQQTCEQWDEDPASETNTSVSHRGRIESDRDLEDFAPLAIRVGSRRPGPAYSLRLSAAGLAVHLYKGVWTDGGPAHAYVHDQRTTKDQVKAANGAYGSAAYLAPGQPYVWNAVDIERYVDEHGVGRFVFEGVQGADGACTTDASTCYVQVDLMHNSSLEPIATARVYIDLHDVTDFYEEVSAGTAQRSTLGSFEAVYDNTPIYQRHGIKMDLYRGVIPDEIILADYVLFVHGWRMRDAEKINFAETSFKRLYWSGYQGRFGALTWPTGWFEKPPHEYNEVLAYLNYVKGNEQNYSNSESVARRVGAQFAQWLATSPYGNVHLVAHSMGNVVVSEALRHGADTHVTSYAASESAEVAGAYNASEQLMRHRVTPLLTSGTGCDTDELHTPEEAWRCYNIDDSDDPYAMPPDKYRYTVPAVHGPTTDENMALLSEGPPYYAGVLDSVDRVVNFYNGPDAALSAWEFNQLTKPDNLGGPTWNFAADSCATCGPLLRQDRFERAGFELTWSGAVPLTESDANILAHIIPARTPALGQTPGAGLKGRPLLGFTASNFDHSAQFHGYFAETRREVTGFRARYWKNLLELSVQPAEYSGLALPD